MLTKNIITFLCFIALTNASRVLYMIMHAEKPNRGVLDNGNKWSSTQDIPNEKNNGLGITGVERSKCLVDVFGKNAVSYRQPKAIIYQHYEKQGDYIDSGERGKHQSRRMYETAALLAKDLGINLDEQKCCGGDPEDMYTYIESLDPSINPILIVHQHQQIYNLASKYAKKYGKTLKYTEFKYDSSIVWTLVEGEVVENWNMGCSFDKPIADEVTIDNLDQLINKGNNLEEINANDSSLLQGLVPLITTKAVPASLLTTVTAKVPPVGASTMGQPSQPATVPAELTTTLTTEHVTSSIPESVTSTISNEKTTTITIGTTEVVTTTASNEKTETIVTTTADNQVPTTTEKAPAETDELEKHNETDKTVVIPTITTEVTEKTVVPTITTEVTEKTVVPTITTEVTEKTVIPTITTEVTEKNCYSYHYY